MLADCQLTGFFREFFYTITQVAILITHAYLTAFFYILVIWKLYIPNYCVLTTMGVFSRVSKLLCKAGLTCQGLIMDVPVSTRRYLDFTSRFYILVNWNMCITIYLFGCLNLCLLLYCFNKAKLAVVEYCVTFPHMMHVSEIFLPLTPQHQYAYSP